MSMNIKVQTHGLELDHVDYDLNIGHDEFKALYLTLVKYFESKPMCIDADPNDSVLDRVDLSQLTYSDQTVFHMLKQFELVGAKRVSQ